MVHWIGHPYEGKLAGHIWVGTQMATVVFKDGQKGTLAWDPRTLDLVVEVPDLRVAYRLSIKRLLEDLEERVQGQQALKKAQEICPATDESGGCVG